MKWLGFITLILIESLAIFGLSLEKIGFTIPQAILISCYVVLLIITITGFIITHFVNLQKERENEFRILVEKLRGQEEVIKTIKEQVFRIGQNVLISEEKLEDIKEEFKRLKWCELEELVAEVFISTFIFIIFTIRISNFRQIISLWLFLSISYY